MLNEASVFSRVKAIEQRIQQTNAKPVLPKSKYHGQSYLKAKKTPAELSSFINAANQTFESLNEKVGETLTEKVLGEKPGSRTSVKFRTVPQVYSPLYFVSL